MPRKTMLLFDRENWLAILILSMGFFASCSDETPTEPEEDATTTEDVGADTTVDVGVDLVVPEEVTDEETGDGYVDPCPGSISCFDPDRERARAAICHEAGMPSETTCVMVSGGREACCVPPFACETNEDCEAAREEEGFCLDERFDCICTPFDGSCGSAVCATEAECDDGQFCRDGVCVDDEADNTLVARIITRTGVIAEGDTRQMVAVAVDPADPSRVFDDVPITWTTSEDDRVAITEGGVITGGTVAGESVITAKVTRNSSDPGDTISVHNFTEASEGDLQVIIVNEHSQMPVEDAWLWIEPNSGTPFEPFAFFMDGTSVTALDVDGDGPVDVTVIHPDFSYVTHVGIDEDVLMVSLPPTGFAEVTPQEEPGGEGRECVPPDALDGETLCYELEGVAAVTGFPNFDVLPNVGEIDVAITGFALGNSLLDLNFELIVGPNIDRDISNGPVPVEGLAEIPGGVSLAFNLDPFVPSYVVMSPPGERALWTLGGRVSLADNPTLLPEILDQIGGDIQIGQIIAVVLPLFSDFYSGIEPRVDLEITDDLDLYELDMALSTPMARRLFVNPPTIPIPADAPLETGIFLAGVMVPGDGFVPLGITAAVDNVSGTPLDGVLDGNIDTEELDPIPLNMAPIHSGIQSPLTQYMLVSLALGLEEPTGGGGRRENSVGNIIRVAAGEALPEQITFSQSSFPMTPDGSDYAADTRTVTIVPVADQNVDFYRVLFKAERGRTWQVHLPPTQTTYVVPNPPLDAVPDFQDRTHRQKISLISVAVDGGVTNLSYADLITPGGATFLDLVTVISEFSILEIGD